MRSGEVIEVPHCYADKPNSDTLNNGVQLRYNHKCLVGRGRGDAAAAGKGGFEPKG